MKATRLYDFFSSHVKARRALLIVLSAALAALASTLHFSEDISDFLPLGTKEREEMSVYQNISGADRLFILFSKSGEETGTASDEPDAWEGDSDAEDIVRAIDRYVECVHALDSDSWCEGLTARMDMGDIMAVSNFVYENAPYFLTEEDYERMDSLLADPHYTEEKLLGDRNALLFPSSAFVADAVRRDPLGLFTPAVSRLQGSGTGSIFELYDDCIFTPDMSRAVVMMTSPFGSSETENNTRLLALLEKASEQMSKDCPNVSVDIVGGPAIAVGNSSRIKLDSVIAVCLSAVLIVLLLIYAFKGARNILLIFASVGWGLLFALGLMAIFRDSVSIIVIGISSVILGIAINYPLHLISHLSHCGGMDRRRALDEIVSPLVVGNITTVGAFLALVPLRSTALRDLGLFASLLLVGTILFVIVFLPHYVKTAPAGDAASGGGAEGEGASNSCSEGGGASSGVAHKPSLMDRIAGFSPEKSRHVVLGALALTLVLSIFSFDTGFDSNMSNINYMTESQRRDMQYFEDLLSRDTTHTARSLYLYSKGSSFDEALSAFASSSALADSICSEGLASRQNFFSTFIVPKEEQSGRLARWNAFVESHRAALTTDLAAEALKAGFSEGAFAPFTSLVEGSGALSPQSFDYFAPLTRTVFMQNSTVSADSMTFYIVNALNVEKENLQEAESALGENCFDMEGMNSAMTSSLSDNFNYIGWACSLIVFFFLWFSFGRLELAVIAFLPMAVSWLWILGLMSILGIKFNIVNIILATFIFGQGDDYTIFITEGCQWEYARRSPILRSYKVSILQSAAIMFVGIGTLIVARHPAMRSLAEVTIIGMFSVVLMAYLIPPLVFNFLTTEGGAVRRYPLTLRTLFRRKPRTSAEAILSRYAYRGKDVERAVRRSLRDHSRKAVAEGLQPSAEDKLTDLSYGELSILSALEHPERKFTVHIPDPDRRRIAQVAAEGFADNVEFVE